ncbi:MAG TPA: TetR/AcrR family transcriptional regulator [Stellaceae bacterium]|nr:TetR/AcrR family transcriptional regulator [Stellaceae bacterium]
MPYAHDMPPARTSYHHGALREALLDACLKLIETEGIGAVSLRRVAREAGVSPGAPYHHFADRAALLSALAAQGYVALAGDFAAVRAAADSPVRELTALIDTYVSFALRQPAYFRLMVRPELHEPDKNPETKAAMHAAERQLQDAVQDCVAAGVIPAERAEALELTVWSIGHGLASLLLDGLLDDPRDHPSALTFQVTALLESFLRRDLSRKPTIRNRAYGHGHQHADWRAVTWAAKRAGSRLLEPISPGSWPQREVLRHSATDSGPKDRWAACLPAVPASVTASSSSRSAGWCL